MENQPEHDNRNGARAASGVEPQAAAALDGNDGTPVNGNPGMPECTAADRRPPGTFARRERTATLRHLTYLELARMASMAAGAAPHRTDPGTARQAATSRGNPRMHPATSRNACTAAGLGRLPPFGYDKVCGLLVQNHDALVVRWVFELCAHGETPRSVAERLNRAEVWRSRRQSRWCAGDVVRMVRMPIYAGQTYADASGGGPTATPGARLVSDELWHAAQ